MRRKNQKNNNRQISVKFKFVITLLLSSCLFEQALAADEPSQSEDGPMVNSLFENFTPVTDAMIQNPISLNAKISITAAMKGLEGNDFSGYPVLKNGLLVGMVSTNDIGSTFAKGEGDETLLEDISEKKIISIYPDQSLLVAFHRLRKYHISRLPVVSRINDRRIVGIITAEDIVSKFGFHVTSEDDDENILEELETVELEN